ncbi:MAG: hypothetical protein GY778_32340 [bacterium]|nr:hypothetical protein [bacterium]
MTGDPEFAFQRYWRNVYLRGRMIHDPGGAIAHTAYAQPAIGIPVERAFIIGPDQTVVAPVFGFKPQLMIDTIYSLLAGMPLPGDVDNDGDVDLDDYTICADCLAGPGNPPSPSLPGVTAQDCLDAFDYEPDGDVDLANFAYLAAAFTGPLP